MEIDAKLGLDVFKLDKEPHIVVDNDDLQHGVRQPGLPLRVPRRPVRARRPADGSIVNWEGCLECGTCLICCEPRALEWKYPRGEFGVQYRMS